jgi:TPR repeat protein
MVGRGMPQDQKRAFVLYEKACKGGDTRACPKLRMKPKS